MKKHTLKVSTNFQSTYPKTSRPKKVSNNLSNFEERKAKAIKEERFKKSEVKKYINKALDKAVPVAYLNLLADIFLKTKKKRVKEGEIG